MVRVESQLALELRFGFVVLLRLPVEIAKAKVQVGFGGRYFDGGFEFGDGFGRSAQAVERFSIKNVGGRGIRVLLQQLTKFFQRARIILRPQAALREQTMQFRVPGIGLRCGFQILDGFRILLVAVVAQAQEGARLRIGRVG